MEKQLEGTLCGAVERVTSKEVSVISYYGETIRLSVDILDTLRCVRDTLESMDSVRLDEDFVFRCGPERIERWMEKYMDALPMFKNDVILVPEALIWLEAVKNPAIVAERGLFGM